jgi:Ca2+-binding RTX toxin-like protein
MDLGEGLSGVTITAGTTSTTTNVGGGWALAVSPGRYRVTASGGPFSGTAAIAVRVREFNVEVDFVSIVPAPRASEAIRPQVFSYQMCAGLLPTILGTGGDDILIGTGGDDVIVGGGGNDTIAGGGGNDTLCGGPGRDVISGGPAWDVVVGGPGAGDRCSEGEQSTGCELS